MDNVWSKTKARLVKDVDVLPRKHRHILLNPGPTHTSARVKAALFDHEICHRDREYSDNIDRLVTKLRRVFRGSEDHSVILITGSGTAAMECGIASCVAPDRKVLVIDNGAFGERLAEIAQLHEMDLVHLRYDLGEAVNPEHVRDAFRRHPDIAVVAMVHHETSVGLLNPVGAIGALCREHDALLLVDAVSSLGAEDLDVVRDNIDVCWSSANKCLHAVSGAGFLCVSPRTWEKIEHVKPRSYYLDLKKYRWYIEERRQTPFTPAVGTYAALEAACDEYLEAGAADRQAMYAARSRRLRDGLRRLGFGFLSETGHESHCIVTTTVPPSTTFPALQEALRARGYIIYDCKPPLQGRYFQIATMGELFDRVVDDFLAAMEDALATDACVRVAVRA